MASIHGPRCATEAFDKPGVTPVFGDVALCRHGIVLMFTMERHGYIHWKTITRFRNPLKYREAMVALAEESKEKHGKHPNEE